MSSQTAHRDSLQRDYVGRIDCDYSIGSDLVSIGLNGRKAIFHDRLVDHDRVDRRIEILDDLLADGVVVYSQPVRIDGVDPRPKGD